MTIDGRLFDSESPTNPLLDLNVLVKIQVLNPSKTCILYEESQTMNTLISNGYFNIQVGSEQGDPKRSTLDSNNSMLDVFYNRTHSITGKTDSGISCNYTPAPTEIRYFRFFVTPSTSGSTQQLSPDMEINSVPQAIVAQTLQGLSPQDVFQTSATSTQAKLDQLLTTDYSNLLDLLAGTSSAYLQNSSNGSILPSRPNDPPAPSPGQVWYDSSTHEIKFYNGTTVQSLGSNNDASKLPLSGGTLTGSLTLGATTNFANFDAVSLGHVTLSPQRTLRLGQFTNAQQTSLISSQLALGHAGTVWFNSEVGKIFYWNGIQEKEITEDTLESITNRGASTPNNITLNNNAQMRLADAADGEYVALQAPSALSANYTLTLPPSVGSANQVLTTDGSGTLSWSSTGAASIADNSLNFSKFTNAMTLDASTDIASSGVNVLSITNTGTGYSFVVNDEATDATPFVVDQNGSVGIGTTIPSGHETGTGTLYHHLQGAGSGEVNISSNGSSLSHRGALSFSNFGTRVAYIRTEKSATSALDAALAFGTNNGTVLSEKMRITQSGNVGIGTTAPSTFLDVAGTITSRPHGTATGETGKLTLRELAASPGGTDAVTIRAPDSVNSSFSLTLPGSAGSANQVLTTDGSGVLSWSSSGALGIADDSLNFDKLSDSLLLDSSTDISVSSTNVLSITNSGTGDSLRINDQASDATPFVVDAAGSVGVGTSSPASLLQIVGAPSAQGLLNLRNNLGNSMLRITPGNDVAYLEALRSGGNSWQFTYSADFFIGNCGGGLGCTTGAAYSPFFTLKSGTGHVGIGTTAPLTNLHVRSAGGSSSVGALLMSDSADSDYVHLDPNFGLTFNRSPAYINNNLVGGTLIMRTSNSTPLDTSALIITSSGSVGIGTSIPSEKLHIVGNLRVQGSTDCTLGNGAGGTNCSSDIRLKKNVHTISHSLYKILSLRGVEFEWNERTHHPGEPAIGVVAQDVEKHFPTAVIEDPESGFKKVDYAVLVAPLIEAVKEIHHKAQKVFQTSQYLQKEIESLKNKNEILEKRILKQEKEFKDRLEKLEISLKKRPSTNEACCAKPHKKLSIP